MSDKCCDYSRSGNGVGRWVCDECGSDCGPQDPQDFPLGADCDVDAMLGPHGLHEHYFSGGNPEAYTLDAYIALRSSIWPRDLPATPAGAPGEASPRPPGASTSEEKRGAVIPQRLAEPPIPRRL